jgi:mannose-6-phosphate isomerase-like protein (cupin superfamily)
MAYTGQTLENPVSGERITFTRTAADTGGELLAFDMTLSPDGNVPGTHVHPEQEERFEIVSGTMKFRLGFKKVVAGPGEVVVVPAGARHRFDNAGDEPVEVRVEVRPALKMEELFEHTVALAREGKTTRKGMPKPVHLALFVREYAREVRAPFPPPAVVRALMAPLSWYGRRRGHADRYAPAGEVIAPRPAVAVAAA